MNLTDIKECKQEILSDRLSTSASLRLLDELVGRCNMPELKKIVAQLRQRHFYMLRTIASGFDVPDFDRETEETRRRIARIISSVEREFQIRTDTSLYYSQLRFQRLRPEENLESLLSDYLAEAERLRTDPAALTDSRRRANLERLSSDIFKHLWVQQYFDEDSSTLLLSLLADQNIELHDRAVWLAAIGLGFLEVSDSSRMAILEQVHTAADQYLSTAALCWIMFALCELNNKGVDVEEMLNAVEHRQPGDVNIFMIEHARTHLTPKLGSLMSPGNFSSFQNMKQEIDDAMTDSGLDLELLRRKFENPENAGITADSLNAMQRMAEAQRRGDDVFYNATGRLRSFAFFNDIANWFMPFHTRASALSDVTDTEGALVADTIGRMPLLCDSDKFALVLSLASSPANMRGQMLEAMSLQFGAVQDSEDFNEALCHATDSSRRGFVNSYMKNLYRFYNLFPQRAEFQNPLHMDFDWPEVEEMAMDNILSPSEISTLGDMYFEAESFIEASDAYYKVATHLSDEQLRRFMVAAEEAENPPEMECCLKEILSRNPGDPSASLKLAEICIDDNGLQSAESIIRAVDNEHITAELAALLAQCLLKLERPLEALEEAYHADFLAAENDNSHKALLAICQLYTGDPSEARKSFEQAVLDSSDLNTRTALAFSLWLDGDRAVALKMLAAMSPERFDENFNATVDAMSLGCPELVEANHNFAPLREIVEYTRTPSSLGNII